MQFYEDMIAERPRIERAIQKYGWAAEHNFGWYQYYQYWYAPSQHTIFAETDLRLLAKIYEEAMRMPPQPGSSKIFWKDLYLQTMLSYKTLV